MMQLTFGSLFILPSSKVPGQLSLLRELSIIVKAVEAENSASVLRKDIYLAYTGHYNNQHSDVTATAHSLQQDLQTTLELHQLTDVVYNAVTSARLAPQTAHHQALSVYTECLTWYQRFLERTNGRCRTPYILLIK